MYCTATRPGERPANDLSLNTDALQKGIEYTLECIRNATTADAAAEHARTVFRMSQLAPKEFRFKDVCNSISMRMPAPSPAQMRYVAYNEGVDELFVGAALGAYGDDVVYVTKVDRLTETGHGFICMVEFMVVHCPPDYVFKEAAWDIDRPAHRPKLVSAS